MGGSPCAPASRRGCTVSEVVILSQREKVLVARLRRAIGPSRLKVTGRPDKVTVVLTCKQAEELAARLEVSP